MAVNQLHLSWYIFQVPGQRVLALQLLVSIFNKAIYNMQGKDGGDNMRKINSIDKLTDWQAIWAFALGPEPQMALSLRYTLISVYFLFPAILC